MKPTLESVDTGDRRNAARGFTLIEVALALIILALVIMSTVTAMQRCLAQLDTARNLQTASAIMQTEMEKERLMSWYQVADTSYQPVIDASFNRIPNLAGRFTLSRSVATLANRNGDMLQITLTVSWKNYDGRTLTRSTTSYYTKDGLHAYYHDKT